MEILFCSLFTAYNLGSKLTNKYWKLLPSLFFSTPLLLPSFPQPILYYRAIAHTAYNLTKCNFIGILKSTFAYASYHLSFLMLWKISEGRISPLKALPSSIEYYFLFCLYIRQEFVAYKPCDTIQVLLGIYITSVMCKKNYFIKFGRRI